MSLSPNLSNHAYSKKEILQEAEALMTGRWITDLANMSSLIFNKYTDLNWAGFYLASAEEPEVLWLGPFQGLPACTMIPFAKGVCGLAARTKQTQLVPDVDQFPGHIVCDSRSRSELVVPVVKNNELFAVLDLDSASLNRFTQEDATFFEEMIRILLSKQNI
ncbi:MAG: GAF domain-containing protein [Pseudobdellovibrio sp.]